MNQNPQKTNVEAAYRTLVVIWLALLASQAMLPIVIYFAKPQMFKFDFSKPILGENSVTVIALGVLAILNLVLSLVIKRVLMNRAASGQNVALVTTAMIVGCALCEAVSLFSVVMAFAFSYQYFFLWFALGIPGTILHFPRRDNLIAASYRR